jgi:hypothetical protein
MDTGERKMLKLGKGRYKYTAPNGFEVILFRDFYTGLWRAKEDGGPIDWTDPRRTMAELKEVVDRANQNDA